ncbi:MAG: helix-turn-helix domain-containing protein [Nitrospirae bacterium]|nr:helix-turn-helix domain-containing protein [Nitrospirota bacterium]
MTVTTESRSPLHLLGRVEKATSRGPSRNLPGRPPHASPPPPLGARLREKREAAGITLNDLSVRTKISSATLQAIENDDAPVTLPEIYFRAHLREILTVLGEDPQSWAEVIALFMTFRRNTSDAGPSPWAMDRRRLLLVGGILFIILGLAVWGLAPRKSAVTVTALGGNGEAQGKVSVELVCREFTSVEYQVDGEEPQKLFLREGERKRLSGRRKIRLILFKPRALDVYYEGKKVDQMEWLGSAARMTFP